ncbi:MAG: SPOR domain-containing protein, partial [Ignavibacteriaceae bacterium]
ERDQLIKAFATKAEVILGGLRKDYDSELENELVVPLTLDLNFLIKTGQKSSSTSKKDFKKNDSKANEDKKVADKSEELSEDGLPWNYGTKFLEKNKGVRPIDESQSMRPLGRIDSNIDLRKGSDISSEKRARLNEFEPVRSHLSSEEVEKDSPEDVDTIKFILAKSLTDTNENKTSKSFTEVRSKTGARLIKEDTKNKKSRSSGRLSETRLKYQSYKQGRNYLPLIILFAFVIIAGAAIYFYFFKGNGIDEGSGRIVYDVKPPTNVNVIERDNEFAVTYPYPKIDGRNKISGYNPDAFLVAEVKPEIILDKKPEVKPTVKTTETNVGKEKPKTKETATTTIEEKQETTPNVTEERSSRIFLYKNYYVVNVGSFNSSEAANREADKYYDLGYNAFVEVIEKRGGRAEYKLNVGDFTSEEFARQFETKYLRK